MNEENPPLRQISDEQAPLEHIIIMEEVSLNKENVNDLPITIEITTPGSLSYKHAVTNESLDSPFNTKETNPYSDEEEADEGEDKLRYVLIQSPRSVFSLICTS
nr:hypothetical protein Itr_chr04CG14770 [Ipomoea trifida]